MAKKLYDYFTDRLKENMPQTKTAQEAFEKTNNELGFEAYSSFNSYQTVRKRKAKR